MNKNLIGNRYGHLVVVEYGGMRERDHRSLWRCVCDCGNDKLVPTSLLTGGAVTSCGCNRTRPKHLTHGGCGTRLYSIWQF